MPISPTYPGIYLEEITSSAGTITGVPTSVTAFLGRAAFGPLQEPTVINNFADFDSLFGGLSAISAMSYAVRDFFLNGGSQAVVVRLFRPDSQQPGAARIQAGFLPLQAANPGAWGAQLRATLDVDVDARLAARLKLQPTDLFNLTVTKAVPGGRSEQFFNVTLRQGNPRWLGTVLDKESTLVSPQPGADLSAQAPQLAELYRRWGKLQQAKDAAAKDPAPAAQDAYDQAAADWDELACDEVTRRERDLQRKQAKLARARLARDTGQGSAAAQQAAQHDADEATKALRQAVKDRGAGASDGVPLTDADLVPPDGEARRQGVFALNSFDLFNLLCVPQFPGDLQWQPTTLAQLAAYCTGRRAFLIVDPPTDNPANPSPPWTVGGEVAPGLKDNPAEALDALGITGTVARNAAVYFPRLKQANPLNGGRVEEFAPCGAVAGVFARIDAARHVWKAPAGLEATLVGSVGLAAALGDADSGLLNPVGINCLRALPAAGLVVWGARTLRGSDRLGDDYEYIPVRRLALYIEESLYRGTQWAVFEPNGEGLWAQLRLSAGAFMQDLYQQGAFQGTSPAGAYFVKCDGATTPQSDVDRGVVNLVIGFAPLKPAEFVIIQLQQLAGQPAT